MGTTVSLQGLPWRQNDLNFLSRLRGALRRTHREDTIDRAQDLNWKMAQCLGDARLGIAPAKHPREF